MFSYNKQAECQEDITDINVHPNNLSKNLLGEVKSKMMSCQFPIGSFDIDKQPDYLTH